MRKPPEWWARAQQLRYEGKTIDQICATVHKSVNSVKYALSVKERIAHKRREQNRKENRKRQEYERFLDEITRGVMR